MAVRWLIDTLQEVADQERTAQRVRNEAAAWRQWSRLGVPASGMLPLGREYERLRIDQPDVRPTTFARRWLPWNQQRQEEDRRALEVDASTESLIDVGQDFAVSTAQEPRPSFLDDQSLAFQGMNPFPSPNQPLGGGGGGLFGEAPVLGPPAPPPIFGEPTPVPTAPFMPPSPVPTPPFNPPPAGLASLQGIPPQDLAAVGAIGGVADRFGLANDPISLFEPNVPFGQPREQFIDPLNAVQFAGQVRNAGLLSDEDYLRSVRGDPTEQLTLLANQVAQLPGTDPSALQGVFEERKAETLRRQEGAPGEPFGHLFGGLSVGTRALAEQAGLPGPVQETLALGVPIAAAVAGGGLGLSRMAGLPSPVRAGVTAFEMGAPGTGTRALTQTERIREALAGGDTAAVRQAAEEVAPAAREGAEAAPDVARAADEAEGVRLPPPRTIGEATTRMQSDLARIGRHEEAAQQFINERIRPVLQERYGSSPDMRPSLVKSQGGVPQGDDILIDVSTAGWERRLEDMGFERVTGRTAEGERLAPGFHTTWRVPKQGALPTGAGAAGDVARPGTVAREVSAPAPPIPKMEHLPPKVAGDAEEALNRLRRIREAADDLDSPAARAAAEEEANLRKLIDNCG